MACLIIPFEVAKEQYLMRRSFKYLMQQAALKPQFGEHTPPLPDDISFSPKQVEPVLPNDVLFGSFDIVEPLPDSIVNNLPDDIKACGMKSFKELCSPKVIDFDAYKKALEKGD